MANYSNVTNLPSNLLFKRLANAPIDIDSVKDTYAELETYILGTNGNKPYEGMVIAVTKDQDSKKNGLYYLLWDANDNKYTINKIGSGDANVDYTRKFVEGSLYLSMRDSDYYLTDDSDAYRAAITSNYISLKRGEKATIKCGNSGSTGCNVYSATSYTKGVDVKLVATIDLEKTYEFTAESDCIVFIEYNNNHEDYYSVSVQNIISEIIEGVKKVSNDKQDKKIELVKEELTLHYESMDSATIQVKEGDKLVSVFQGSEFLIKSGTIALEFGGIYVQLDYKKGSNSVEYTFNTDCEVLVSNVGGCDAIVTLYEKKSIDEILDSLARSIGQKVNMVTNPVDGKQYVMTANGWQEVEIKGGGDASEITYNPDGEKPEGSVANALYKVGDITSMHRECVDAKVVAEEALTRLENFDYEICVVHLQNESGEPLSGVEVNMILDGETTSRTGITDEYGKYSFPRVAFGTDYEVYSANVEGYVTPISQNRTAALAERHVYITYNESESEYEQLQLRFKYSGTPTQKAEYVKITYDGNVYNISINQDTDIATAAIPKGTTYRVEYPNIDVNYQTPAQHDWVANRAERIHNVYYYTKQSGYTFLRKDGQEVPISAVRPEMRDDIVGLIIDLVDVIGEEQRIVIDKDFPTLYKTMAGVNNNAELVSGLSVYVTNPPTNATSDFNGYGNCIKLKENIRSISSSKLFDEVDLMSIEINGAEYGYYAPSCGELSILFNNKDIIYDLFFNCLGIVYPLKSPIYNQRYGSSSMSLASNTYCPVNYVNGSLSQINGTFGSMTTSMYWFVLIKYNK